MRWLGCVPLAFGRLGSSGVATRGEFRTGTVLAAILDGLGGDVLRGASCSPLLVLKFAEIVRMLVRCEGAARSLDRRRAHDLVLALEGTRRCLFREEVQLRLSTVSRQQ